MQSKVFVSRQHPVLTSMMGLEAKTFSSTLASLAEPLTVAKYLMAYLADTVFPAPDSPLTMIDWFLSSLMEWKKRNKTVYIMYYCVLRFEYKTDKDRGLKKNCHQSSEAN